MTAQNLLDQDIEPLALTDTVGQARRRFSRLDVGHLPVVSEEGQLVALLSREELRTGPEPETALGSLVGLGFVSVSPDAHVFEAAGLMAQHHLSALPVATPDGAYIGLIRRSDIFDRFAGMLATGSSGAILLLEIAPRDYSLGQLAHLIEQNGAKVLSISVQGHDEPAAPGAAPVHVTLKLNVTDTARLRHVLEHHGYHVVAAFNEDDTDETFNHRLAEFLRYLEV